jgi:hypothetical protein
LQQRTKQVLTVSGVISLIGALQLGPRIISLLSTDPKELATTKDLEAERRVGTEVVKRIDLTMQDMQADLHDIRSAQERLLNIVAPRKASADFQWERVAQP